jgi:hypothetical protein
MRLTDALLLEPYAQAQDVWIALRTDGVKGSGTENDPYDGSRRQAPVVSVSGISYFDRWATATTVGNHGYHEGEMVTIDGVTGNDAGLFKGTFPIYDLRPSDPTKFKYWMTAPPGSAAGGSITSSKVIYQFDVVMSGLPAYSIVRIGPGTFGTRGCLNEQG